MCTTIFSTWTGAILCPWKPRAISAEKASEPAAPGAVCLLAALAYPWPVFSNTWHDVMAGLNILVYGRYKLVPEGEGRELDIPAARCQQVLAFAVSKTNNADKEVWDIVLPEEKEDYEQVRQCCIIGDMPGMLLTLGPLALFWTASALLDP